MDESWWPQAWYNTAWSRTSSTPAVRFSSRLAWIFAASDCVWLAILVGLTLSNSVSRDWFGLPPAPLGDSIAPP